MLLVIHLPLTYWMFQFPILKALSAFSGWNSSSVKPFSSFFQNHFYFTLRLVFISIPLFCYFYTYFDLLVNFWACFVWDFKWFLCKIRFYFNERFFLFTNNGQVDTQLSSVNIVDFDEPRFRHRAEEYLPQPTKHDRPHADIRVCGQEGHKEQAGFSK